MEPNAPVPPPPPEPAYKRVIQTSRRLSYVNFGLKWFNTELLSDIEIFSDVKSSGNARSFHCHQLVLFLVSPTLLEAIKKRPYEDNTTSRYIIIEELQGKDNETELFLKSFYDPQNNDNYDFKSICRKYFVKRFEKGLQIHDAILPQTNSDNTLSDIKLNIKDSDKHFNCHKLFLAHNSEYFYGLFSSDMKDSRTNQCEISSPVLSSEEVADGIGLFLESLYYGEVSRYPTENVDKMFVGYLLTNQYLLKNRARWLDELQMSLKVTANIAKIICNALRFDVEEILQSASETLSLYAVQVALSYAFDDIPNEYLESVTTSYKEYTAQYDGYKQAENINFIQACLRSSLDEECVSALTKLTKKLRPNSSLNLRCLDQKQNTCLHLACLEPKPKTVKFLLDSGLVDQIEAENSDRLTAIQISVTSVRINFSEFAVRYIDDPRVILYQRCFSAVLAKGATLNLKERKQRKSFLILTAAFSEEDPTLKAAKKLLEEHIDFSDKELVEEYGIKTAIQIDSEAMMKFYFVEKGMKGYRLNAHKYETEEFGHSIADDRGMWQDLEMISVPMEISVKDRSALKFDSHSVNMKGAKYDWDEFERKEPFIHSSSYEARDFDNTVSCPYLRVNADGKEWKVDTLNGNSVANLILFFIHSNNPGYKEKKLKEEKRRGENNAQNIVFEEEISSAEDKPITDPQEFAKSVLDSTTTAAMNITKKNKKDKN